VNQEHVIRLHYDHFAGKYDEVKPSIKRMLSRLDDRTALKVLDIGCATGYLLSHLAQQRQGQEYVGIDLSEKALNIARVRAQHSVLNYFSFVCANANSLPFASHYFNAVVSNAVFHLLLDQRKALEEVIRVLKPGGVAVLQFPGGGDIEPELFSLLREAWNEAVPQLDMPEFFHTLTLDTIRQYLIDLGISCFEISYRQSRMRLQEADIDRLLEMFHLVGGLWRWTIDSPTADCIEQVVAAKAAKQISSQGYFCSTRSQLLIEITKPA